MKRRGIAALVLALTLAVVALLGGGPKLTEGFFQGVLAQLREGETAQIAPPSVPEESGEGEGSATTSSTGSESYVFSLEDVPEYNGEPFVELNGNRPCFEDVTTTEAFESYSPLDELGRCGPAFANVCPELMPTEERGAIGAVKPTGWHTVKYEGINGKYLYNRCHLIAYQLTGENANRENLVTGTRSLNVEGMLPFEIEVADYVEETGNHVLYRATPVFAGEELLCRGIELEAWSVEDAGEGVCFHVWCYNAQPGIGIDYATGESALLGAAQTP
jgi:DNA-entry nuclease